MERHLERCPSCAGEATFERLIREVAAAPLAPDFDGRRARLWARVASATVEAPAVTADSRAPWGARFPHGRPRAEGPLPGAAATFATLSLLVAVTLMGYFVWTGGSPGPPAPGSGVLPRAEPRVAQTELRLWEAEPSAADPMGPTTARLLSLLEGES